MLMIRLQRVGKRNSPVFRLVVTNSRNAPKSGSFLEILGSYNPRSKGSFIYKKEQVLHWVKEGAQLSDTVHNFLVRDGVVEGPKRSKVPLSKLKKKGEGTQSEILQKKEIKPEETKKIEVLVGA